MMCVTEFPACSHPDEFLDCAMLGIIFKRQTNETLGVNIEIEKHK
jgi:hypothetical protein